MSRFIVLKVKTLSGEIALHVRQGSGMPILFWPSIFYDHRLYDELVARLDNPVAVLDGPGHGGSGINPAGLQGESLGRTALALACEAFGDRDFAFAGTSWGALAGLELARLAPRTLKAAAFFNAPWNENDGPSVADRAIAAATGFIGNSSVFKRGVAKSFFAPRTFSHNPDVIASFMAQQFGSANHAAAVRSVMVDRYRFPLAGPSDVHVPALVVSGALDTLYPASVAHERAGLMADAAFVCMEGAAHIVPAEAPARSADLLRSLIARTTTERTAA